MRKKTNRWVEVAATGPLKLEEQITKGLQLLTNTGCFHIVSTLFSFNWLDLHLKMRNQSGQPWLSNFGSILFT